jgi:hypothetical protein
LGWSRKDFFPHASGATAITLGGSVVIKALKAQKVRGNLKFFA